MAGNNEVSRARLVGPAVGTKQDGSPCYDSAREPEATGRPWEQNWISAGPPLPGTLENMIAIPTLPGSPDPLPGQDDLLTPAPKRGDSDDYMREPAAGW